MSRYTADECYSYISKQNNQIEENSSRIARTVDELHLENTVQAATIEALVGELAEKLFNLRTTLGRESFS